MLMPPKSSCGSIFFPPAALAEVSRCVTHVSSYLPLAPFNTFSCPALLSVHVSPLWHVGAALWMGREKQMRLHRNTFLAVRKDSCYGNHLSPLQLRNPTEGNVCVCVRVM